MVCGRDFFSQGRRRWTRKVGRNVGPCNIIKRDLGGVSVGVRRTG